MLVELRRLLDLVAIGATGAAHRVGGIYSPRFFLLFLLVWSTRVQTTINNGP